VQNACHGWIFRLKTPFDQAPIPTMTTNTMINRIASLALLFMIYAVGVSMGRDQVAEAHHNHPACHQGLKP
jgi:hypothetical protein